MKTRKQFCFTYSSGEDIYLYTLYNTKRAEVLITNYGAIITSFKIKQPDGSFNDIVLGFDKVGGYWSDNYLLQYPWFGCAVGRYANRIKNATFIIDEKQYFLSKNNGNEHLHGGANGFDKKVWKFVSMGEMPQPFLELKYRSADKEEGYPGNLEVAIRFELNDNNELSYQYIATCDQPTAINLTHHSYFNLNNGEGTIKDHAIKIYASTVLEQDNNLVATGNLIPVENTVFDFRKPCSIGERLTKAKEYDNSFAVDKKETLTDHAGLSLAAEAISAQTKIKLQVYTTEPIVHLYSGKWIPVVKGKNSNCYGPFSGFCLETHKHPNAINIPGFPNTILRPGETYYQKTVYKVIA